MHALELEMAALIAKHGDLSGRGFVDCALRVAEGYFEPTELPMLADVGEFAEMLSAALRDTKP